MNELNAIEPGEVAGLLVGSSVAVRELRQDVVLASQAPIRVMIAGESGVGKKRLARLIHQQSVRSRAPFLSVRCASLESTIEPYLFGDSRDPAGMLERAAGGTVFLEDIDALTSTAQARLRRFVSDGDFHPAGGGEGARPNVRVVCATSTRLTGQLANGTFCQELYYLLNTIYLRVPPLRERRDDIEPLLEYFTAYYARRLGVSVPSLTVDCRARCRAYHWPGNTRQLQTAATLLAARTVRDAASAFLESAKRVCGGFSEVRN